MMEVMLDIYVDISQQISFLFRLLEKTEDEGEWTKIDKAIRSLELAKVEVRRAAFHMSYFVSGSTAERYRNLIIFDRWQE
jgi:hypothetical protein